MVRGLSFNPKKNKFEVKDSGLSDDEKKKAQEEANKRNEARRQEAKNKMSRMREEKKTQAIDEQTIKNINDISQSTGFSPEAISNRLGFSGQTVKSKVERLQSETQQPINRNEARHILLSNARSGNLEKLSKEELRNLAYAVGEEETGRLIELNNKEVIRRNRLAEYQTILDVRQQAQDLRSQGADVQIIQSRGYGNKTNRPVSYSTKIKAPIGAEIIKTENGLEVANRGASINIKRSMSGRVGTFKVQEDKRSNIDKFRGGAQTLIRNLETDLVKRKMDSPAVINSLEFVGGAVSGASMGVLTFEGDNQVRSNLKGDKVETFENPIVTGGKLAGAITEVVYNPVSKVTSRSLDFASKRIEYSKFGEKVLTSKPFLNTQNQINAVLGLGQQKIINPVANSRIVQNIANSQGGRLVRASMTGIGKVVSGEDARSIREDLGIINKNQQTINKLLPFETKNLGRGKVTDESFNISEKAKSELFTVQGDKLKSTNIEGYVSSKSKGSLIATGKDGAKLFKGVTETKTFQEKIISPEIKVLGKTIFKPIKSSPQFVGKKTEPFLAISKQLSGDRTGTIIKTQSDDLIAVLSSNKNIGTSAKGEEIIKSVNRFGGKTSFGKTDNISRIVQKKADDVLTLYVPKTNNKFVAKSNFEPKNEKVISLRNKIDDLMNNRNIVQQSVTIQKTKPTVVSLGFGGVSNQVQAVKPVTQTKSLTAALGLGIGSITYNNTQSNRVNNVQLSEQVQKQASKQLQIQKQINKVVSVNSEVSLVTQAKINASQKQLSKLIGLGQTQTQTQTQRQDTQQVYVTDTITPIEKVKVDNIISGGYVPSPKIKKGAGRGAKLPGLSVQGKNIKSIQNRYGVNRGLIKNPFLEAKEIQKRINSGIQKRQQEIKARNSKFNVVLGQSKKFKSVRKG